MTIALVSLVYILPLGVALSLDKDNSEDQWSEWTDGHFARIAADHVLRHPRPARPTRALPAPRAVSWPPGLLHP